MKTLLFSTSITSIKYLSFGFQENQIVTDYFSDGTCQTREVSGKIHIVEKLGGC